MLQEIKTIGILWLADIQSQFLNMKQALMHLFGYAFFTVADIVAFWAWFATKDTQKNWELEPALLLWLVSAVAQCLSETLGTGIDDVAEMARNGEWERAFLRPRPLILQALSQKFPLRRIGRVLPLLVLAPWIWSQLTHKPQGVDFLWLLLSCALMTFCWLCLHAFVAGVDLMVDQTSELSGMLLNGSAFMANWPASVWKGALGVLVRTLVPLLWIQTMPIQRALHLEEYGQDLVPIWAYFTPLISVVLGWAVWKKAMRVHQVRGH